MNLELLEAKCEDAKNRASMILYTSEVAKLLNVVKAAKMIDLSNCVDIYIAGLHDFNKALEELEKE